jgi:hypothetical protein
VGALDGYAESLAGEDVGGGRAAADVRCAAGRERAIEALRAAQAELDDRVAAGREADARGLGRDERLVPDHVDERGLQYLRLYDWTGHARQRLVREHDRAFRHRVDVAGELDAAEVGEEIAFEDGFAVVAVEGGEVGGVFIGKVEVAEEIHDVSLSACDCEAPLEGAGAEKEVEGRDALAQAGGPVCLCHGELVEVRGEGEGGGVDDGRGHGGLLCISNF